MANGKLNRKYYPIIWIALLIACFVRNAYQMYVDVVTSDIHGSLTVFLIVLRYLLTYGIVPMAVVVLCAFVVWHAGAFRYVRYIPRADFCYLVMAATAVVKFFVGIIEVFSILEPGIYTVTSTVLEFTLLTIMMFLLFFFVISKQYNFNPVEKYNAFKMWSIIYMVVLGLSVLSQNALYLSAVDNSELSLSIWAIMREMGYSVYISGLQVGASIAAICIYFAFVIAAIVLGEIMRKKADLFRNPETRGEFYDQYDNRGYKIRNDADRVFNEANVNTEKSKQDENVFDEFDI